MIELLDEYLAIQGIPLEEGSMPPRGSVQVEAIWVSEPVTLLDGRTVTFRAERRSGHFVTVGPGDEYAVSLDVKRAVEAAHAAFTPVTVTETLSDPAQRRTWAGLLTEAPVFTVVPGFGGRYWNYSFKLRQEEA